MDVAEGILDILVTQIRGDFEGVRPTPGEVEPAAMPEDVRIQLEGEARPCPDGVQQVVERMRLKTFAALVQEELVGASTFALSADL